MSRVHAFTLPEVLIALVIFSIVALSGFSFFLNINVLTVQTIGFINRKREVENFRCFLLDDLSSPDSIRIEKPQITIFSGRNKMKYIFDDHKVSRSFSGQQVRNFELNVYDMLVDEDDYGITLRFFFDDGDSVVLRTMKTSKNFL